MSEFFCWFLYVGGFFVCFFCGCVVAFVVCFFFVCCFFGLLLLRLVFFGGWLGCWLGVWFFLFVVCGFFVVGCFLCVFCVCGSVY